eukprot:CAMPEP_0115868126 /NCGR_PEP_ID=MMETSP0287-20121206/21128_1 /TAXON_ID=412157 /ORGANISM="Chrysochromulina rotalis, Strain UIO044" /LENGTH=265 /DNA_ID=CAMNT_0003322763 /DNA_START=31 /DNA_END=828 /DNA_ORIENTATION=+
MSAKIFGVPASQNCAGPVMLAMEAKAGGIEVVDMASGAHKKDDYLAINAYGQVPAFQDGDVKIGQSNAILRYLAIKYKPDAYPSADADKCAKIDFAIESLTDYVYPGHKNTVYVVLGFSGPPDDQAAENKAYATACEKWLSAFVGESKFCGGDVPSIADYKAVPFFYAAIQPAMKANIGLEMPERVAQYAADFAAAVSSSSFMESAGGWSIKELAASKESVATTPDEAPAVKPNESADTTPDEAPVVKPEPIKIKSDAAGCCSVM